MSVSGVVQVLFFNNSAPFAGAVGVVAGGSLTVVGPGLTTFTSNSGGGIYVNQAGSVVDINGPICAKQNTYLVPTGAFAVVAGGGAIAFNVPASAFIAGNLNQDVYIEAGGTVTSSNIVGAWAEGAGYFIGGPVSSCAQVGNIVSCTGCAPGVWDGQACSCTQVRT